MIGLVRRVWSLELERKYRAPAGRRIYRAQECRVSHYRVL